MVTVTIKEQSKQARAVVEMLKTFPFVEFKESSKKITSTQKPRYNAATEKAIKDARKGIGLTPVKNVEELFQLLND